MKTDLILLFTLKAMVTGLKTTISTVVVITSMSMAGLF